MVLLDLYGSLWECKWPDRDMYWQSGQRPSFFKRFLFFFFLFRKQKAVS